MREPHEDAMRQRLALSLMPERRAMPLGWLIGLLAVTFAACATLYWALPVPGDQGVEEVLAAGLRARTPGHATQLESDDPRLVQNWLDNHLPLPVMVPDLSHDGFALIGARLDIIAEMTAACILYGRNGKLLDLCIWPRANTAPVLPDTAEGGGYWILSWRQKGAALSAISDLDRENIEDFRTLWTRPRR